MTTNVSCERVEELIPKVVDREALDWEIEAVEGHLASCASCASLREELVGIGAWVRRDVAAAVEAADFSGVWAAVERGMDRADAEARAERIRRLFSFTGLSRLVAAGAVAAAFAWALLLPDRSVHEFSGDNRVEVSSVEGGAGNTVMIYESEDDNVTFIWVFDETHQERAL